MNYLLDTCVISEFTKRQPDRSVVQWLADCDELSIYLSVLSIGEIQKGIQRLPDSPRKTDLTEWLETGLIRRFQGRLLILDTDVMLAWGSLVARLESAGQKMPAIDSLIAATALHYGLILATRNLSDFEPSGVKTLNPWQ